MIIGYFDSFGLFVFCNATLWSIKFSVPLILDKHPIQVDTFDKLMCHCRLMDLKLIITIRISKTDKVMIIVHFFLLFAEVNFQSAS